MTTPILSTDFSCPIWCADLKGEDHTMLNGRPFHSGEGYGGDDNLCVFPEVLHDYGPALVRIFISHGPGAFDVTLAQRHAWDLLEVLRSPRSVANLADAIQASLKDISLDAGREGRA